MKIKVKIENLNEAGFSPGEGPGMDRRRSEADITYDRNQPKLAKDISDYRKKAKFDELTTIEGQFKNRPKSDEQIELEIENQGKEGFAAVIISSPETYRKNEKQYRNQYLKASEKIAKEKLRAVSGLTDEAAGGEINLYVDASSNKEIFKSLLSASKKSPKDYLEAIENISTKIGGKKRAQFWAGVGISAIPAAIEAAYTSGAASLIRILGYGAIAEAGYETADKNGMITAISRWNDEDFKSYLIAIYPLFLSGEVENTKQLRATVNDLTPANVLKSYIYNPPSVFSGKSSHEEESDSTILRDLMAGPGTGNWAEEHPWIGGLKSGEERIATIIKRRVATPEPDGIIGLYNEFNKMMGSSASYKKSGGINTSGSAGTIQKLSNLTHKKIDIQSYFDDIIDWLWLDGLNEEAIIVIKALMDKGLHRASGKKASIGSYRKEFEEAERLANDLKESLEEKKRMKIKINLKELEAGNSYKHDTSTPLSEAVSGVAKITNIFSDLGKVSKNIEDIFGSSSTLMSGLDGATKIIKITNGKVVSGGLETLIKALSKNPAGSKLLGDVSDAMKKSQSNGKVQVVRGPTKSGNDVYFIVGLNKAGDATVLGTVRGADGLPKARKLINAELGIPAMFESFQEVQRVIGNGPFDEKQYEAAMTALEAARREGKIDRRVLDAAEEAFEFKNKKSSDVDDAFSSDDALPGIKNIENEDELEKVVELANRAEEYGMISPERGVEIHTAIAGADDAIVARKAGDQLDDDLGYDVPDNRVDDVIDTPEIEFEIDEVPNAAFTLSKNTAKIYDNKETALAIVNDRLSELGLPAGKFPATGTPMYTKNGDHIGYTELVGKNQLTKYFIIGEKGKPTPVSSTAYAKRVLEYEKALGDYTTYLKDFNHRFEISPGESLKGLKRYQTFLKEWYTQLKYEFILTPTQAKAINKNHKIFTKGLNAIAKFFLGSPILMYTPFAKALASLLDRGSKSSKAAFRTGEVIRYLTYLSGAITTATIINQTLLNFGTINKTRAQIYDKAGWFAAVQYTWRALTGSVPNHVKEMSKEEGEEENSKLGEMLSSDIPGLRILADLNAAWRNIVSLPYSWIIPKDFDVSELQTTAQYEDNQDLAGEADKIAQNVANQGNTGTPEAIKKWEEKLENMWTYTISPDHRQSGKALEKSKGNIPNDDDEMNRARLTSNYNAHVEQIARELKGIPSGLEDNKHYKMLVALEKISLKESFHNKSAKLVKVNINNILN